MRENLDKPPSDIKPSVEVDQATKDGKETSTVGVTSEQPKDQSANVKELKEDIEHRAARDDHRDEQQTSGSDQIFGHHERRDGQCAGFSTCASALTKGADGSSSTIDYDVKMNFKETSL